MNTIINNIKNNFSLYLPNISNSFLLVLVFIVGGSLLSFLTQRFISDNILLLYVISFIPPIILIYFVGKKINDSNVSPKPSFIPISDSNYGKMNPIIFYASIAISMLCISVISDPLTSLIPMPDYIKKIFEALLSNNSIWQILSVVIAAPILEELLLRGVIERGIIHHSGAKKAIIWSAFLFAFMHLNIWQGIGALLFGLFLGWIYWRTHSIFACIFMHFINNGSAVLLSKLFPNISFDTSLKDLLDAFNIYAFPILLIVSILILITLVLYLNKKLLPSGELFKTN